MGSQRTYLESLQRQGFGEGTWDWERADPVLVYLDQLGGSFPLPSIAIVVMFLLVLVIRVVIHYLRKEDWVD